MGNVPAKGGIYLLHVLYIRILQDTEEATEGDSKKKSKGDKKLKNQFNYSERASQTYNYPLRVSLKICCITHVRTYVCTYELMYVRTCNVTNSCTYMLLNVPYIRMYVHTYLYCT